MRGLPLWLCAKGIRRNPVFQDQPHPAFECAGVLTDKVGNVVAIEAKGNQECSVQWRIAAGFPGSQDFLLHGDLHIFGI